MKQLLASQEVLHPRLFPSVMAAIRPIMGINRTNVDMKLVLAKLLHSEEEEEDNDGANDGGMMIKDGLSRLLECGNKEGGARLAEQDGAMKLSEEQAIRAAAAFKQEEMSEGMKLALEVGEMKNAESLAIKTAAEETKTPSSPSKSILKVEKTELKEEVKKEEPVESAKVEIKGQNNLSSRKVESMEEGEIE